MINPNTNKSLTELLSIYFSEFSDILNCIKIGEIVSFDKTNQTATIKILHKKINENYSSSNVLVDYPLLQQVPCVVMSGGTSYISHPISAGDQCVVLFSDYMIDGWKNSGETRPSDFPRRHDISDAIAIVGLRALPNAIQSYSDFLDLHYSDNSSIIIGSTVEVNNQTINLNGNTNVTGDEVVTGSVTAPTLNATTAANGTFVSADNKTITVVNGIVTSIA
jgi:hypothetical protein